MFFSFYVNGVRHFFLKKFQSKRQTSAKIFRLTDFQIIRISEHRSIYYDNAIILTDSSSVKRNRSDFPDFGW